MSAALRGCALPRVSSRLSSRTRVPASLVATLPGRRRTLAVARPHTVCAGLVQKVNAEEVCVCGTNGGVPVAWLHFWQRCTQSAPA
jgi:hypothetical protein